MPYLFDETPQTEAELPYQGTPHLIRRMRRLFEDYEQKYKLNLSKTATLGEEESGRCRDVLNKSQSMDFLSVGARK